MRHDDLRELTALAHTVPGVTLRLHCTSGAELLVSAACLGADLDPCRLRATLLRQHALPAAIERAELVAGLRPLGAGVYQRTGAVGERWFVTALAPAVIVDAIAPGIDAPVGNSHHDACRTVVRPDPELGLHAVCVRAIPDMSSTELDEVAVWALGRVLVAELAAELHDPAIGSSVPPHLQPQSQQPRHQQPRHQQPQRKEHP